MPPWHIDKTVGVQKFKNDMSLSDDQIDKIVAWVDQGAPQGDPKDMPPPKPLVTDNEWKAVRDGFGPPDLVVKSPDYTMAAEHQDVWFRPMSDIPITEPHWVKLVEIRPTNLKARRIIHHSIAYLVLNNDPEAVNTGTATGPARGGFDDGDLVNRRPQLMEWAIGKGYDLYRPGTGKLIVPGEKISWDQHIHAVGEEITGGSDRHLVLQEGRGAEEAQLSDRLHRDRSQPRTRHPAQLGRLQRRLHRAEGQHAHHELPAALPSARQGDGG
jgi:hypothetical protein